MSNPTGIEEYPCTKCFSKFSNMESLQQHIYTTHPRYICNICQKVISTKKNYKRHLKEHNSRSYSCDLCIKNFKRLEHLNRHMIISHSKNKFKCNSCGKLIRRKDTYYKHLKTVHGIGKGM